MKLKRVKQHITEGILLERKECAQLAEDMGALDVAKAIRARRKPRISRQENPEPVPGPTPVPTEKAA